jgi:hypothetical protein
MTRIAALDNLTIEIQPDYWRLSLNGDGRERVLVEAAQGRALRYINGFAERRKLPQGALPSAVIRQVVLGWSESDQSWHLGLVFTSEFAAERGSRWCEIARWYDPQRTQYRDSAELAGQALAQTLARPYRFFPPRVRPDAELIMRELPALPLRFGLWTLTREDEGLVFALSGYWLVGKLRRMMWYGVWATIYAVLSTATLTVKLALPNSGAMLPNPQALPYLGLGIALILLLIVFKTFWDILTHPQRIIVNAADRTLSAKSVFRTLWTKDAAEFRSVYVSQVVSASPRRQKRMVHHGELNLHIDERRFFNVLVQDREEERTDKGASKEKALHDDITLLTVNEVDADLQAAAIYLADALGGLPVYYDQRLQ